MTELIAFTPCACARGNDHPPTPRYKTQLVDSWFFIGWTDITNTRVPLFHSALPKTLCHQVQCKQQDLYSKNLVVDMATERLGPL